MKTKTLTGIEQELLSILKKEYSFYQSLYILLDKQSDIIKYDKDENLLDLYAEIERCQRRIKLSDDKVQAIRQRNQQQFQAASVHPEIKKTTNCIITLVKKNIKLVADNEQYAKDRHARIKDELEELKNSHKIMQYLGDSKPPTYLINGTK